MHDHVIRLISENGKFRAIGALTTQTAAQMCDRHTTSAPVTDLLARVTTAGVMMGALLKDRQRTSMKFEGNGPIGKLVCESDAECRVRAYPGVPQAIPTFDEFGTIPLLGRAGLLTIVKDIGLRTPYTGTVHLQSGNIADDVAYYLTESEQTPAAVGIGTFVDREERLVVSGGFLIQSLPPYDSANIESVVNIIQSLPPMSKLLLDGESPESILKRIFSEVPMKVVSKTPIAFYCNCSRERFEQGLITLGKKELIGLSEDNEEIEIVCEFCKEKYYFTKPELEKLAASL